MTRSTPPSASLSSTCTFSCDFSARPCATPPHNREPAPRRFRQSCCGGLASVGDARLAAPVSALWVLCLTVVPGSGLPPSKCRAEGGRGRVTASLHPKPSIRTVRVTCEKVYRRKDNANKRRCRTYVLGTEVPVPSTVSPTTDVKKVSGWHQEWDEEAKYAAVYFV